MLSSQLGRLAEAPLKNKMNKVLIALLLAVFLFLGGMAAIKITQKVQVTGQSQADISRAVEVEKVSEPSAEKNSAPASTSPTIQPAESVNPVSTPVTVKTPSEDEKIVEPAISPEQDKKYSPEMVALWVGDFYDAHQSLKINSDGTYRQLSTINDQLIDFNAWYAVRGSWRVAEDELLLSPTDGNCEFCPKTLKIIENGSALALPNMGPEFVFRKQ